MSFQLKGNEHHGSEEENVCTKTTSTLEGRDCERTTASSSSKSSPDSNGSESQREGASTTTPIEVRPSSYGGLSYGDEDNSGTVPTVARDSSSAESHSDRTRGAATEATMSTDLIVPKNPGRKMDDKKLINALQQAEGASVEISNGCYIFRTKTPHQTRTIIEQLLL